MPSPDLSHSLLPWERFCARNQDHPALQGDSLYAIPEGLLRAIEQEAPEFLTTGEKKFERDLARYGGVGFHHRRPIRIKLFGDMQRQPLNAAESQWRRRVEAAGRRIEQLFNEYMESLGRRQYEVEVHRQRRDEFRTRVLERQRGYVGWLLTNPDFRAERDAFFTQWKRRLRLASREIGEPISREQLPNRRPHKRAQPFWASATQFLWKWGLEAMATPDLPLPMDPGLERPNFGDPSSLRTAGTVLFIPWYMVVDKDMRLDELIDNYRLEAPLSHLEDWLRSPIGRGWGFERFGVMLRLYVWIGLALGRRYPDRMAGRVLHLDRALARFEIGDSATDDAIVRRADSIRRARTEMNRRLQPAQANGLGVRSQS
jgi:hypothetical protein